MRMAERAAAADASPSEAAGMAMLATLMALAALEHWFLVAPLDGNALWRWAAERAAAPRSCAVEAPEICDARGLARMLDLVAGGAFGEVDSVRGKVRTPAHWVAIECSGGGAQVSPCAPDGAQKPSVVAMGRRFDLTRLQAAFDGCAVAA